MVSVHALVSIPNPVPHATTMFQLQRSLRGCAIVVTLRMGFGVETILMLTIFLI